MQRIAKNTQATRRLLRRLQASPMLRRYSQSFTMATGLHLSLHANDASLPAEDNDLRPLFCRLVHSQQNPCRFCIEESRRSAVDACRGVVTSNCFAMMQESSVPIVVHDEVVGFLKTGGVFARKPQLRDFTKVWACLRETGWKEARRHQIEQAWMATQVIGPARYGGVVGLLHMFGEQLAAYANGLALNESKDEPESITNARRYIRKNLANVISLGDVSNWVNLSEYHFCRLFKSVTGWSFVEFVQRSRIHWAKQELIDDSEAPISEVARKVGFRSISQFNRSFAKISGESPRDFRRRLNRQLGGMHAQSAP